MTTILLGPGAWITPAAYQPFLQSMSAAGYDARCASYPSLDPEDPSRHDCRSDAEAIKTTLYRIIEEGKDVVLILHSYAGMPGAAAAVGLSRARRAQEGKHGGVIGLIFIGAFIVPETLSCAGLQGGNLPPWILLDQPSPGLNIADSPAQMFTDPDTNPELLESFLAELKPHATLPFTSPQPPVAWAEEAFQGRLASIVTANDRAVPKEAQYGMMAATQKNWIVREIASSHCGPFLNQKEKTIELIRGIITEMIKV